MDNKNDLEEDLKKVALAGVGAAAITVEKSKELFDILADKGAETIEKGKAINEELKHKKEHKDIDSFLDGLTPAQMEELREKLRQKKSAEEAKSEQEYEKPSGEPIPET